MELKMNKFRSSSTYKDYSPYRINGNKSIDEKNEALAFAKKLREKHINEIKESSDFRKKLIKEQKLNDDNKKSLEIADDQNKKFKDKFNEESSLDDLFNTLSDDLKSYQK